jgi:TonB family protein
MMFGHFMDWFERHKFGVIGTLMLHTMVMFILAVSNVKKDPVDVGTEELALELEAPPTPPPDEQMRDLVSGEKVTNLSSNMTAEERERTNISRSAQERISENVEQDLKEFERAEFERLAEERTAAGEDVVMPQLDKSKWDPALYREKKPVAVKVEGNATVEHDLKDRTIIINIPAYKCKGQGVVKVFVDVSRSGAVERSTLGQSSSADECLIENALAATRGARFTSSSSSPDPQHGTITFRFVAQ